MSLNNLYFCESFCFKNKQLQNSKLKTQNSKLKTQNSKLKTQNSKLKTQNSKLKYAQYNFLRSKLRLGCFSSS